MRVHLGGHLSWYDSEHRAWLDLNSWMIAAASKVGRSGSLTPADVAQHLGLPRGEIALVVVNDRIADLDVARLEPGDRVEFYPPIGGG